MPAENISKINNTIDPANQVKQQIQQASNVLNTVKSVFSNNKNKIGSVLFEPSSASGSTGIIMDEGKLKELVGYPTSDKSVPAGYLVTIKNSDAVVNALMQENINLKVTSEWVPFIKPEGITADVNSIAQILTKHSLISRQTSRRIWQGTSPIEITVNLKLEAVYDAKREVVRAAMRLQQMALPSEGSSDNGAFGWIPTLIPPGPSPFSLEELPYLGGADNTNIGKHLKSGDRISITLGQFLSFYNIIVKDVSVDFSSRLTVDGDPIGAIVSMTFQTYEILTKDKLRHAYEKSKK